MAAIETSYRLFRQARATTTTLVTVSVSFRPRFNSLSYRSEIERLTPTQLGFQILDWEVPNVRYNLGM